VQLIEGLIGQDRDQMLGSERRIAHDERQRERFGAPVVVRSWRVAG